MRHRCGHRCGYRYHLCFWRVWDERRAKNEERRKDIIARTSGIVFSFFLVFTERALPLFFCFFSVAVSGCRFL